MSRMSRMSSVFAGQAGLTPLLDFAPRLDFAGGPVFLRKTAGVRAHGRLAGARVFGQVADSAEVL